VVDVRLRHAAAEAVGTLVLVTAIVGSGRASAVALGLVRLLYPAVEPS